MFCSTTKRLNLSIMLICLFVCSIITTSNALADDKGFYVTGFGGVNFTDDLEVETGGVKFLELSPDAGIKFGGSIGYDLGMFRTELEVHSASNKIDGGSSIFSSEIAFSGDVSVFAVMGNLFIDLEIPNTRFTPYVGGGIGWAQVDIDSRATFDLLGGLITITETSNDSDSGLVGQVIAGMDIKIIEDMSGFVDYRFFMMDKVDLPDNRKTVLRSHSLNLGLRYTF